MARRSRQSRFVVFLIAVALVAIPSSPASAAITQLTDNGFTGTTVTPPSWTLPPPQSGTNTACLTASANTSQTPIPGCALSTPDTAGNGALRLTNNTNGAVGMTFYTLSLPTNQGLHIKFNSYQYNGTNPAADGIAFMLAAANPANPTAPASTGPLGGALGYTTDGVNNGLPYGYLGLGLDVWGNYTNSSWGGAGCAVPGGISPTTLYPQQLTARGPGNGTSGYCILSSTAQTGGLGGGASLDNRVATSRTGIEVPVEIGINPTSSPVTDGGLTVPANSYLMTATPLGGTQKTITGLLPTTVNTPLLGSTVPSAWINPTTHIPYQLTLGWAASTGSANEIHEISELQSSTLSGPLPVWTINSSISGPNGKLPAPGSVDYTLTPTLSPTNGSESEAVTVITTLPAGVTPGNATGTGWTCNTAGQTVTCIHTATAVAPGDSLPPISVPATVSSSATGSLTTSSKITSVDSFPQIIQRNDTVANVPSSPGTVSSEPNGGTAIVDWNAPSSDGGAPVTQYKVTATPAGGGAPITTTVLAPATSATIYGLAENTTYNITVEAINGVGSSSAATTSLTTEPQGYWLTGEDGGVFAFGNAGFFGSATDLNLNKPIVGMVATPDKQGYWLVATDGGVFSYGNAKFYGSTGNIALNKPIIGMASTPDGGGYWLVAEDGGVFAYGNAKFYGSTGGMTLAKPVVGIAAADDGAGYWLVAADGGVFSYGTAVFRGSTGGTGRGNVVGITTTSTGDGYWLVAGDGAVFAYGDAGFHGAGTDLKLKGPLVGIAATPSSKGYWLAGNEGGVFAYGDARFLGSMAEQPLKKPVTAITAS